MCEHVQMRTHEVCVYKIVSVCVYVCVRACMYACVRISVFVCVYACVCVCACGTRPAMIAVLHIRAGVFLPQRLCEPAMG